MSKPAPFDANAGGAYLKHAWAAYVASAALDGEQASASLRNSIGRIASSLGVRSDELVFTSGGTAADALAIQSSLGGSGCPHLVTTAIEHAAVSETLSELRDQGRIRLTQVSPGTDGRVDATQVIDAIESDTCLVTVVLASNETGVLQPVSEIGHGAASRGVPVHTDAVQALGRMQVDAAELAVQMLSASAHKIGGVGGVGVLVVRDGHILGTSQVPHNRLRSTAVEAPANVPGLAAFAAALETSPWVEQRDRVANVRDRLEAALVDAIADVRVLGKAVPRLCNTSCFHLPGCPGDAMMMALDVAGFAVSTGSACSTGTIEPSPILMGMGMSKSEASECLRVSLPWDVDEAKVSQLVEEISRLVTRLR